MPLHTLNHHLSEGTRDKLSHCSSTAEASVEIIVPAQCQHDINKAQALSLGTAETEEWSFKHPPQFTFSELSLSELLGKGGFCDVYGVDEICLRQEDRDDDAYVSASLEQELALSCACRKRRYVVKCLRSDLASDHSRRNMGAQLLKNEAKILASLQHDNVIEIRGVGRGCCTRTRTTRTSSDPSDDLFLILDRCSETMLNQIEVWKKKARQHGKLSRFLHSRRGPHTTHRDCLQLLFAERLQAAAEIAAAISYLHSRNILFLDLKPENLGFSEAGTLKLFDFGLAKPLLQATSERNHTIAAATPCPPLPGRTPMYHLK
jgi:serine/threonine protein kinase